MGEGESWVQADVDVKLQFGGLGKPYFARIKLLSKGCRFL